MMSSFVLATAVQIGPYRIDPPLALAPMAGITDKPFRQLCRKLGAGYAVAEMTSADPKLRDSALSLKRRDLQGEASPRAVQLLGFDPQMLAEAARQAVDEGAQIVDLNMGCPAKRVCNREAGSALLKDEALVARILETVVRAVKVPVTLKMRTGYSRAMKNGLRIARIAEDCGIAALAIHGRTREDRFLGEAEYETIAAIKATVRIPVWANGDIDSPEKAERVLCQTGADGLMIGRAAQGRPWIFREIAHFLATGKHLPPPSGEALIMIIHEHLEALHAHYGREQGVLIARKHLTWYLERLPQGRAFRPWLMSLQTPEAQRAALERVFAELPLAA
ncbi:MAG: tRNA-dihydrouridine synthase B [Lysobacterales bacterium]|jgi:tRNA-dihydrouridine synthase B|nr:MAG: tRNA-dihydrouridine synthase B [Xanthomonadales bacterium]